VDVSSSVASLVSLSEPALQPSSESSLTLDVAPPVKLIRQPSPPPIAAPVQTVQAVHDAHDHSQTQLSPDLVADPRPGEAQALDGDLSKGPKHLHIVSTYNRVFVVANVVVNDFCLILVEGTIDGNAGVRFSVHKCCM